jgi:hypothetical protein
VLIIPDVDPQHQVATGCERAMEFGEHDRQRARQRIQLSGRFDAFAVVGGGVV